MFFLLCAAKSYIMYKARRRNEEPKNAVKFYWRESLTLIPAFNFWFFSPVFNYNCFISHLEWVWNEIKSFSHLPSCDLNRLQTFSFRNAGVSSLRQIPSNFFNWRKNDQLGMHLKGFLFQFPDILNIYAISLPEAS